MRGKRRGVARKSYVTLRVSASSASGGAGAQQQEQSGSGATRGDGDGDAAAVQQYASFAAENDEDGDADVYPSTAAASGASSAAVPSTMGEGEQQNGDATGTVQQQAYSNKFWWRRLFVFIGILLGYSSYYLTRNSLTFTAPVMVADPKLNIDITSVGVITSIFPLCYGVSKFVAGVVGDKLSPAAMLGTGLLATGAVNIAFGCSSVMAVFCTLWALNGMLQGFGAPSCAKILTNWFASKERGTWWGMWNIAHNVGGFSAPILSGTAARSFGWSWGLWAPGIIGVTLGTLLLAILPSEPERAGFAPVEDPASQSQQQHQQKQESSEKGSEEEDEENDLPLIQNLFKNVLSNPFVWLLALTYFCVYIVRQGVTSWAVFYLINEKGVADAGSAALRVSGLELGGLVGSLFAGRVSDFAINNFEGGNVGKRVRVVMAYLIGVAGMLFAFQAVPAQYAFLQSAIVFMIGFFLYGPQMLIGLCGAEIVGRKSVGASEGFLGWVAYLGAANAGIPLSLLVNKFGWNAFFTALFGACGVGILLLAPAFNAPSEVQRRERQQLQSAAAAA